MASILFGAENIDADVRSDVETVLEERADDALTVYEDGDVFLISSSGAIDQGDVKVAFNGYLVDARDSPEQRIAAAYRKHGDGFAAHLDGAFRIVIYDTENGSFHATADKAGRKVIYYSTADGGFLCSSHLIPLLRHPSITPRISPVGVADLIQGWSASFAGGCRLIKDVQRLHPSHHLSYRDGRHTETQFWDTGREKLDIPDDVAVQRLDELLTEGAEKLVEQVDGSLNVFLSGGFDSTFLIALLREVTDLPINTFTWGWEEEHFQDGRRMADRYGTDHTDIWNAYAFPSDTEVWFYEEPQNAFIRYPFRELYREHGMTSYWTGLNSQATFPVCLKNIRKLDRVRMAAPLFRAMPTTGMKSAAQSLSGYKMRKAVDVLESDQLSTAAVIDWSICRDHAEQLCGPRISDAYRELDASLDTRWDPPRQSYQEAYSYLQLRARDTARYAYYAQDMEHYDVYGYTPLLEFSYSLPMAQKKNRRLLQKIARGRVPDRIITKGASGWDFVSNQFRQTIEQNEDEYRETIGDAVERGILDGSAAQKLLLPDDFDGVGRGRTNQMIAMYLLERWMKLFVDRDEPWRPP